VEAELGRQLATAARREILERSLGQGALIVIAPDRDTALGFVNDYAPEHLSVVVEDVEEAVARLRNAGSLFVGPYAPESAGDYASGANHVLPTGGLARSCGALATEDYGKFVQIQRITRDGLAAIRDAVEAISEAEGLIAHKRAVELRFEDAR
jgi:histidinol dehydrogenase